MSDINKKLLESLINKIGKEGISHYAKTGELPAIKLTPEEMDYLKAGFHGDPHEYLDGTHRIKK